jgi:hypothetical protein
MRHPDTPAGRRPPADPARRGQWIVTIAVVSASMGAFLLLGGSIAGALRHFLGLPIEILFVLVLAAGVAGVWAGAWLAGRLTGGNRRRYLASGIGGSAGLLVAVGLAYASTKVLGGILDLLAILSPGTLAALAANAVERDPPTTEP